MSAVCLNRRFLALIAFCGLGFGSFASAQNASVPDKSPDSSPVQDTAAKDTASKSSDKKTPPSPDVDLRNRPLSEKQKKEQQKARMGELGKYYKKWLDEDVRYIITDEERAAFKSFSNDEERDQFIEQFWLRRDPTPDTVENEYKEEHYRRIAYANEHFPAGIPGWKTDRGRMYVMYGAPDSIDSHPSGGSYQRTPEEGGGQTSTFPFETWRYRYLEGVGQEVEIEFVDTCMCNDYHMTLDRSEKDALLHTPNGGLTDYEAMGLASKASRFTGGGLENLGAGPFNQNNQSKQFDRLEQFAKLNRPPAIKFKDLEEVITTKIHYNVLPFDVRADFVKVTNDTALVPFTVQIKNKDVTFVNKDGVQRATINILGRVTTMTGRIAQTFEDTVQVDVPAELLPKTLQNASVYPKALPLRPGRYRVDVVVKDVNGDRVGTWSRGIVVPDFSEEKGLTTSTLILADLMEKVPAKSVGAGNFVIGNTKVRPRVEPADGKPASFKRNQRLNFWMQVYNLTVDEQTKKSLATVEYDIINSSTKKSVVQTTESTEQMGNVGDQMTLEKSIALTSLEPGIYELTIKVNDKVAKQTISPTARFVVE